MSDSKIDSQRTITYFLRHEWKIWAIGAAACIILVSVLISGWPQGLIPDLRTPYAYVGDGLSHSWLLKRAIEGWIFDNPRSGYPFGSIFLDYPGSDAANLLILKVLGLTTGSYVKALNLFILNSFALSFITAYIVSRAFGLRRAFATTCGILFTFLPFHFFRFAHLFYLSYFIAPLFIYHSYSFYRNRKDAEFNQVNTKNFLLFLYFMCLGSFGVYYAFFGVVTLFVGTLGAWLRARNYRCLNPGMFAISAVCIGVFVNLSPNIAHRLTHDSNPEVGQRLAWESELYALKLAQLILPRPGHRIEKLANIERKYSETHPLINENAFSSNGIISAFGLILSFYYISFAILSRKFRPKQNFLSFLILIYLLFGTIGGFGSLFALFVSPLIRAWNRISVFIAFPTQLLLLYAAQKKITLIKKHIPALDKTSIPFGVCVLITSSGLYDQTTPADQVTRYKTKKMFLLNDHFIKKIEATLPHGSAVYQLPYMSFPEVRPLHKLESYEHAIGFLHSKDLKWNYAGIMDREGDYFYRNLSKEPVKKQVEILKKLGFAGVYIDRRGYEDNGKKIIKEFTEVLGSGPTLSRGDGEIVFFKIDESQKQHFDSDNPYAIMKQVGYVADKLGKRYNTSIEQGIDFKRADWPFFVKNVYGFSSTNSFGRATYSRKARIELFAPLPGQFQLEIEAKSQPPHTKRNIEIRIGSKKYKLHLSEEPSEHKIEVNLEGEGVKTIEFAPIQNNFTVYGGGQGANKKLGMILISLRIKGKKQ